MVLVDTTEEKSLQSKIGMRNIFRINNDNEILWQVNVSNAGDLKDTFMYLGLNNKGALNADTFFGMKYFIDIETGMTKRVGWHK